MDKAHVASVLEKQQKSMNDLIQDIALEVAIYLPQTKLVSTYKPWCVLQEYAQMQAFQGLQLEKDMVYKNITNHVCSGFGDKLKMR